MSQQDNVSAAKAKLAAEREAADKAAEERKETARVEREMKLADQKQWQAIAQMIVEAIEKFNSDFAAEEVTATYAGGSPVTSLRPVLVVIKRRWDGNGTEVSFERAFGSVSVWSGKTSRMSNSPRSEIDRKDIGAVDVEFLHGCLVSSI